MTTKMQHIQQEMEFRGRVDKQLIYVNTQIDYKNPNLNMTKLIRQKVLLQEYLRVTCPIL